MPRYIDLKDGPRTLGTFDLPEEITGTQGHQFRLVNAIQGGGNGVVFRAFPRGALSREIDECAVKILRQTAVTRIDRFMNEKRIMAMLQHDRIAPLYDSGTIRLGGRFDAPWLAMELGGANLRRHVQEVAIIGADSLPRIGTQICDALDHIHQQGVIHRDIKPDNFVWDGESDSDVTMIDFGIAKLFNEDVSARPLDQFTQEMEFVGPVFFSSPELIAYANDKSHPVDHRSDLFQFGKVLWFLATGRISAGIPSRTLCPLDGRIHALVTSLIADDPGERPQSAAEVRRLLASL